MPQTLAEIFAEMEPFLKLREDADCGVQREPAISGYVSELQAGVHRSIQQSPIASNAGTVPTGDSGAAERGRGVASARSIMLNTTDILTQIMAEVEASDCGLEPAVSGFPTERQADVQESGRASRIAGVPIPSSEDIAGLRALLQPYESIYGALNWKTPSNLLRAATPDRPTRIDC